MDDIEPELVLVLPPCIASSLTFVLSIVNKKKAYTRGMVIDVHKPLNYLILPVHKLETLDAVPLTKHESYYK